MNTEQLKIDTTKEDFLQAEFDKIGKGNTTQVQFCYKAIFNAMNSFASQESKRAVDEFKEKLRSEVTKLIDDHHSIGSMEVLTEKEILDLIDKL